MQVVIAPESEVSEAVRDCLVSWSRAGLLGPFCLWLVPVGGEDGTAADSVARIERGELRTGSLAEALQGTPSDRVALVGFYAAGPRDGFDSGFAAAVERCISIATEVLAFEKGHPIECTVMAVPEEIGQEVPLGVFCGTWNLYVAPEDRAAPPEANQLPNSDGLLPRHAAHALATIADLWANSSVQSTGALAAVAGREVFSIDPPAVRVVRCFSRVVDLGYVSDHVAAGVFKAGTAWPNPDPSHFDRVADPSRVVTAATKGLMAMHGEIIGLTDFQPLRLPPEKRPKLLEALRELIQMIEARIRRLPSDLADATLGKAHDHLAGMIDRYRGSEAAPTLRWRERPAEERSLADLTGELRLPLFTPDGSTAPVWRDLRQLSLGLIDGSPLPERIDGEAYVQAGKRALVTNPEAIVPDPELEPPGPEAGRPCDPLNLDPRFLEPEGEAGEGGEKERDGRREELEEWAVRFRPTLLWSVGAEIAAALEVARAAAAELEVEAIGRNEDEEGEAEGDESADAGKEASKVAKEAEAGKAGRARWRGLRNTLLFNTILAAIVSALAWTNLDLLQGAIAQVLVVAGWTAALLRVALRFVHRERTIMREEIVAQLEIVNAATRRALYAGDQPRLERRYGEYLDWAEMIGWMAHHPWVGEPIGRIEVKAPVSQGSLPSAFRVGAGVVPAETLERLCGQARASVFDTGWLLDQYRSSLDESNRRVGLSRSYAGADGSIDPDGDVLEDPDSPRRQLRNAIRRGDGRHLKDNEMTESVLRFVDQLPLDAAAAEVSTSLSLRRRGADPDDRLEALPPCPAWFAPPAHFSELTPRILESVVRISASSPMGPQVGLGALIEPGGQVVTADSVVANASAIHIQFADGTRCEASLDRASPAQDLALLRLEGLPESFEAPAVALSDRDPQLGDPIFAPSPPDREPGQPEVALGVIVTIAASSQNGASGSEAAWFGTTYRTGAGPAGSPVFDLRGGLLGIHRGAQASIADLAQTSMVRRVSNAAEVRALLEAEESEEPQAQIAREDRPTAERVTEAPSRFLEALFAVDPKATGFLPQHWVDSDDQHMPEVTLGLSEFGYASLQGLAAPVQFLQPVRVIVHRVDITGALAARELRSCAEKPR